MASIDGASTKASWSEVLKTFESTPPPKKRPKKSLIQLSEDQWKDLSPKGKWDCIAALRGPDLVNSQTLKWFTSSVIRYALSKVMRVGGLVNDTLPFVIIPQAKCRPAGFDASHFLGHVQEAANWLSIPVSYCGQAASEAMFQGQSTHEVYKHLADDGMLTDEMRAFFKASKFGGNE